MKKIKKILSITLAMVLIFTATACSSKTEPAASADSEGTQKAQAIRRSRNSLQVVKPHSRLLPAAKQ